jgi:hypothetical protein
MYNIGQITELYTSEYENEKNKSENKHDNEEYIGNSNVLKNTIDFYTTFNKKSINDSPKSKTGSNKAIKKTTENRKSLKLRNDNIVNIEELNSKDGLFNYKILKKIDEGNIKLMKQVNLVLSVNANILKQKNYLQ